MKSNAVARVVRVETTDDPLNPPYPSVSVTAESKAYYGNPVRLTFEWSVEHAPRVGDNIRVTIEWED